MPIHTTMLSIIAQYKPATPIASILDVGCGTGRLLRALASRYPDAQLNGIDPAEQMIHEATKLHSHASFNVGPAEKLPYADNTFDLVCSSISFHHWADQAQGLREIARVLRAGGMFCLADHTVHCARLFNENVKNRRQVRELLINAGFGIIVQKRIWQRFVLINLAKK